MRISDWSSDVCSSDLPEIILGGNADDAFFGETRDLLPQVEGFVVRVVDGGGQFLRRKAPFLRQQGPGVGDRLFLEIVAEAEIAQHFEESMVARRVADIVEVVMLAPGADRSEEHTSELQSLMRISYAVFCLKK